MTARTTIESIIMTERNTVESITLTEQSPIEGITMTERLSVTEESIRSPFTSSRKALIVGNWKCNGTCASIKQMIEVLNNAGPFSEKSEVVIAMPSLHLHTARALLRPDIATSAEDVGFKRGYGFAIFHPLK